VTSQHMSVSSLHFSHHFL